MDLILLGVSKLFLFDHYIKYCKHNVFVVNSEYKTKSQNISTGSFVAQYTITPSANANKSLIDDADIMTELSNQIKSGHLPAPKLDTHGNPVTYYAVYFHYKELHRVVLGDFVLIMVQWRLRLRHLLMNIITVFILTCRLVVVVTEIAALVIYLKTIA